jgi:hypothetical protein
MKHITARILTAMCAITLASGPAMGENIAKFAPVPIPAGTVINNPNSSPGAGTLDGFHSYDLILNTDDDWGAAALLITLSSGQFYQEGEGFGANGVTLGQPDPAGFGVLPSSEFDTYIFDPHGGAGYGGPALDLGGDVLQFDTNEIDISWYSNGTDVADIGRFSIGRFTWSGDTNGTIAFYGVTADYQNNISAEFNIINGVIPEPASLSLLCVGGLGLLRRRRG